MVKVKFIMSNMETLEQKKRRLFGRKYLPEYLKELSRLLKREVKETELLSIIQTDEFIDSIRYLKKQEVDYKVTIKFSNKNKMLNILQNIISDWNVPYVMYLSYSLDCGLMQIPSLHCFNFSFNFDDENAGIIEFTRVDGKEDIVLDYYEEHSKQLLDIKIYKEKSL